jgi:hypothetical protein
MLIVDSLTELFAQYLVSATLLRHIAVATCVGAVLNFTPPDQGAVLERRDQRGGSGADHGDGDGPVHTDAVADDPGLARQRGDGDGRHRHVRDLGQLSADRGACA